MKSFVLTPSMGKRLIGKALAVHPAVAAVLKKGTLVIVAGTTNGYAAEEILTGLGQAEGFARKGFRRGLVAPAGSAAALLGAAFPGDVVIADGQWRKGQTIFDVSDDLKTGDVILKGANALHLGTRQAAVLIGDSQAGTAGAAVRAAVGRRVRLIVPVGLEKRVAEDVNDLARAANAPDAQGPRLLPLPGEVFTELEAVSLLTGATARLLAGGGIYGAEGAVWLAVGGAPAQVQAAEQLISSLTSEPPCQA